jgi:hypothetical protein
MPCPYEAARGSCGGCAPFFLCLTNAGKCDNMINMDDHELLQSINENVGEILRTLNKPESKILKVINIVGNAVGIAGIFGIIDTIRHWIIGG